MQLQEKGGDGRSGNLKEARGAVRQVYRNSKHLAPKEVPNP